MAKLPNGVNPISTDPDDSEQSGLLNDVDVQCDGFQYTTEEPPNYSAKEPNCFLKFMALPEGMDEAVPIWISAGKLARLEPTEDGEFLVPAEESNAHGLSNQCNLHLFNTSLKACGLDMSRLGEGISVLNGLNFHLLRVPAPRRSSDAPRQEGERERTVITCAEINKMPWDKAGAKKPAGKGTAKPVPEAPADDTTEAQDAVVGLIGQNGGIPKSKLYNTVFAAVKKHPSRKAILEEIQDAEFLETGEAAGLWAIEGNKIVAVG